MKKELFLERLGASMKEMRKKRGLTQKEVADKAEISQAHYTHVESGNRPVSILRLFKVAEALDCDLAFDLVEKEQGELFDFCC